MKDIEDDYLAQAEDDYLAQAEQWHQQELADFDRQLYGERLLVKEDGTRIAHCADGYVRTLPQPNVKPKWSGGGFAYSIIPTIATLLIASDYSHVKKL